VDYLLICAVALFASGLTFLTGFGLGTLLLPAFAVFFPIEVAVALTAIVHLLNNLFKLALIGRRANLGVATRFGLPAIVAAFVGARLLSWLSDLPPLWAYELGGRPADVTPVEFCIAILMLTFAVLELWPGFKRFSVAPRYLPVGGILTGFFGGLSGHQGAFRSAFLLRTGLSKEAFIATGVVIASVVDLTRLAVYAGRFLVARIEPSVPLVVAATGAAFAGAVVGNRMLRKISLRSIEIGVAILLALIAVAVGTGLI